MIEETHESEAGAGDNDEIYGEAAGDRIGVGDIEDVTGAAIGRGAQAATVESGTVLQAQRDITVDSLHIYQQSRTARRGTNRQAVPPPDTYVPRTTIEGRLRDILLSPSKGLHIVGLYGLPGFGKTWLSRQVAVDLGDKFPDGTLWVDMQTTTTTDALWRFIEPYDPSIARSSLHQPTQYLETLQRLLADKRVLIVLDQVESTGQANGLLPTRCPNVVVLVISDSRLPGLATDAHTLHLPEMKAEEAEKLFRNIWVRESRFRSTPSETIHELAQQLYFIPASMAVVAQDILNTQIAPADYAENLRRRKSSRSPLATPYDPGFEAVYENLPVLGKRVLPFIGIVGGSVWRLDALVAVSQLNYTDVEAGLRQLLVTGFVNRESPRRLRVSPVIRDFALAKLEEIGGEALVAASRAVMAHHYLHTSQQVIRRYRRMLLNEFLLDEVNKQRFTQVLNEAFSTSTASDRSLVESSLARIDPGLGDFDLVQDTFERVVLANQRYFNLWANALEMNLPDQKHQLEEALTWALEREDWPLVRRFAVLSPGDHMNYAAFSGDKSKGGDMWLSLKFDFGLIRIMTVENIYIQDTSLRAVRIIDSNWSNCEFISADWLGVHVYRASFESVDMVGATMPGLVVTSSSFVDVDLRGADLRGAVFDSCSFANVNFRKANLEEAEFVNCSFSHVDFRGTVFEPFSGESLQASTVKGRIIPGDLDRDMVGYPEGWEGVDQGQAS